MEVFGINTEVLDQHLKNIGEDRINFLIDQAKEQLDEINSNEEIKKEFLKEIELEKEVDDLVLWILFMSNEEVVAKYIKEFKKDFFDFIPINDITDLCVYLSVKYQAGENIEGIEELVEFEKETKREIEYNTITTLLMIVQEQKKMDMQF